MAKTVSDKPKKQKTASAAKQKAAAGTKNAKAETTSAPETETGGSIFGPLLTLRRQIDEIAEDAFGRLQHMQLPHIEWPTFARTGEEDAGIAKFDFSENDKAVTVSAEMPGMSEDDVEILVDNGVLAIKGEKKSEREEQGANYYLSERRFGSFTRAFRLPDGIVEDEIGAEFNKGVLTVTMPKAAGAKKASKRIAVKSS